MWTMECVSGVERAFIGVRNPAEDSGVGSLALWPMIKPDGDAAGDEESGAWCNDIRNAEISVLV